MKSFFTPSEQAIVIGLFLSRFDKVGLKILGFAGFWEAYNTISLSIGVKATTIKNYRDEFDPYFSNSRKGWHRRAMKEYCKPIYEYFRQLDEQEYLSVILNIISVNQDTPLYAVENTANRLITGVAAEQYFVNTYQSISIFSDCEIINKTLTGCGYDFELHKNNSRKFCIEVKGLSDAVGTVSLTNKEYETASTLRESYCLFIVSNFKRKPTSFYVIDPINSSFFFKRTERIITTINYTTYYDG